MKNYLFLSTSPGENVSSAAILFFRLFIGVLMITHGWAKIENFEAFSQGFPDPIGLGSKFSLILAIGAEVFASFFLILGLLTRLSLIPLIFTMGVAFFVVHANDPFQQKELALIYLGIYAILFLLGPGRYSADRLFLAKVFKIKD